MAGVLFEDIFNVKDIDPEGKKFDRGKQIFSCNFETYNLVDLHFSEYSPNLTGIARCSYKNRNVIYC